MPLNQAIYVTSEDKIFGVHGPFVMAFSAQTGALLQTFRFARGIGFGESDLLEFNGALYACTWRGLTDDSNLDHSETRDIYLIDYGLTTSTPLGIGAAVPGIASITFAFAEINESSWQAGFRSLVTDGAFIYGLASKKTIFQLDPTNVAGIVTSVNAQNELDFATVVDLDYMPAHGQFLCGSGGNTHRVFAFDAALTVTLTASVPFPTYGAAYAVNVDKGYFATANEWLVKADVNMLPAPFTAANTANILPAGSNPIRIRYNPNDGLLYVPTFNGDSVCVVDPNTDALVECITGFDTPIDVVFTGTKNFAVQMSAVGLKEIL